MLRGKGENGEGGGGGQISHLEKKKPTKQKEKIHQRIKGPARYVILLHTLRDRRIHYC